MQNNIDFRDRDLIFVDIETTGLNPTLHEFLEIGAVRVDRKALVSKDTFEIKVKPLHLEQADKESLDLTQYSDEKWQNAVSLEEAITRFNDFSEDGILAGWNISFDWGFLAKAFYTLKIEEKFDYHRIDIMSLGYEIVTRDRSIEAGGLGLRKFAKYFSIDFPEIHSALSDARLAFEVYKKLQKYEI